MDITFFAHKPLDAIRRTGFYTVDIDLLTQLGHRVRIVNTPTQLPTSTDLYFVWWWTAAFAPLSAAILRRRPVIVTGVFNYDLSGIQQPDYLHRPWWHKRLIAWTLRRASANIFLSSFEHRLITDRFEVAHPTLVPLGVDTNYYAPPAEDARDPFLVLNVAWSGRYNAERKCLFEIVESIPLVRAQVPQVRFVFCGKPGYHHPRLVQRVQELGVSDSVEFRGMVDDSTKVALMKRCAVYLSPSLYEGFGLAIAEAMSCGAAVVSSPVGSIPEVVGDAGVLVDGRNVEAVAAATVRLLKDATVRQALGAAGRQRVIANFTNDIRREGLQRVIEAVA